MLIRKRQSTTAKLTHAHIELIELWMVLWPGCGVIIRVHGHEVACDSSRQLALLRSQGATIPKVTIDTLRDDYSRWFADMLKECAA